VPVFVFAAVVPVPTAMIVSGCAPKDDAKVVPTPFSSNVQ
jgi:hypothetical protein